MNNNSKIPQNQTYKTNTKLSLLKFKNKDIINIIRSLNEDKAHGHVIRMLKICDTAIAEPLSIIFNNCKVCSLIIGKDQVSALFIKKVPN